MLPNFELEQEIIKPNEGIVPDSLPEQTCRSGGTGRHATLRGQWALARGGSNPLFGTNLLEKQALKSYTRAV